MTTPITTVEQRLRATGKTVITVADLIRAGVFNPELTLSGIYLRLAQLPPGERPEDHGGVRAGGSMCWFNVEAAVKFAEHHRAYWMQKHGRPA